MTGQPGLPRRTLFRGAGAVLVVTGLTATGLSTGGCDRAGSATPQDGPSLGPSGGPAVITWGLEGGYNDAAIIAIRPQRLAIYADGVTIADAAYRSTLTASEFQDLRKRLVDDLRAPHTVARTDGTSVGVIDAPTTVITVVTDGVRLQARADALDDLREEAKYSATLYDARDRLGSVYKDVVATAQPYLAERVRLVAAELGEGTESRDVQRWPAEVPLPTKQRNGVRYADLDGETARQAVRLFTRDLDHRGAWPVYEVTDGTRLRAAWRYLLPDE
jgi:hypothetical protein